MKHKACVIFLLFAFLLSLGCVGAGSIYPSWTRWQTLVSIAVLTAFFISALEYMLGYGFESEMLKASAKNNTIQTVITVIMVVNIGIAAWALDSLIVPEIEKASGITITTPATPSLQEWAKQQISLSLSEIEGLYNIIHNLVISAGREASKSGYCSILGVGYTIVGCRTIGLAQASLSQALNSLALARTTLYTQLLLLEIAKNYMFNIVLPLGIILRALPITRKAGGALMAIAVGFYMVFPLMIITDTFFHNQYRCWPKPQCYYDSASRSCKSGSGAACVDGTKIEISTLFPSCDPYSGGYDRAFFVFITDQRFVEPLVYNVLILSIIFPGINLFATLAFVSAASHIMGADVDVSGLQRVLR